MMSTSEMSNLDRERSETEQSDRLPITALLALALAGFVTILTEALPAGLLPQIGAGLEVSESLAGQLVTLYAIGSLVAAIPLMAATQGVRRRPLLLAAIVGFAIANTITTLSTSYILTMMARFLAGVAAGLLWALLAGYAARMVPEHLKGRAIAIAMVGTPLALSLGVPAGTFLGTLMGWRACFGIMTLMALILIVWVHIKVPDFAGQSVGKRLTLRQVFTLPGIRPVLFVVLAFVLAHNILYTYIAPFLADANLAERTDLVLLVFGIAALVGIWVIGVLIDRYLRVMTLASTSLFGVAALMLGIAGDMPVAIYVAVGAWGLAFGGAATLFQTALAKAAGEAADVAQSMLVTVWNLAIAGGGVIGGVLLDRFGAGAFPPALLVLLTATLLAVWAARKHGFPVS
ncbi:MFS transporter [Vreelandella titanicae]|jgi:predicted MFS family arabinose efflux permease|uniref:Purine ribonucleoside efflux pump NepI n=1 Tax=Vreelandella titanicae TaxID=664683 RepID=A0AAP9NHR0_9GAMM|nr:MULTISPECIES: MFS transporter [Halomonas]QKS22382.1 Purine ribonucleoside efflux pump NepI [Halomonas titanicae]CDG52011.1 Major facilitator superfamily MFS_1 [Halomonas sp. A3H3]SDI02006.1 Predicted arabinose efflux permease, MFS family [Halomonas titanicae]|tara:strand:+ start:1153 stop:2361 length:1209 start_codon:yes stop_codon:yes gene_type:complete